MKVVDPLTEEHIKAVCKFQDGHATCRFLTLGPDGMECAKYTNLHMMITQRADEKAMRAQGDNCEGMAPLNRRLFL